MIKISASIVIYNEYKEILENVINSFLAISLEKELIIVDNSPNSYLKDFIEGFEDTTYLFSGKNIGFGAGHNLAFQHLSQKSDIHIIINPDTYFDGKEIKDFLLWLSENKEISLAVPKVLFPDGTLQYTVRNIPTPMSLIKRRLNVKGIFNKFVAKDEFRNIAFVDVTEIPFAHGCFFAFKTDAFEKLGGFDERFLMYMEDVDIFIRAKEFGKTVINPNYKIYHEYRKGSSKNLKLLQWHISSAIKFFLKYNKFNQTI